MASSRKPKADARPRAGAEAPAGPPVQIRLADDPGHPIPIAPPDVAAFQSEAMRWSYVVRNRERWWASGGDDPAQGPAGPLSAYLDGAALDRIARAGVVEVAITCGRSEAEDWAYRIFPWEYAIAAATRRRRSGPLLIVRHLVTGRPAGGPYVSLERPATIECAPGRLGQQYDTRGEGDLMLQALGLKPAEVEARLRDPTAEQARAWIARVQPSLLHLAGVDTHQAIDLLGLEREYPASQRRDGFALRATRPDQVVEFADSEALGAIVNAAARKPDLVMCNVYNSGSRLASRVVAHGARAAIGYHDVIDDSLAVLFSTTLYRQLSLGDPLLQAFRAALDTVRRQELLRGAGIVLWSAESLLQAPSTRRSAGQAGVREVRRVDDVPPRERVVVRVKEKPLINYSLLHNGASPFRELVIERGPFEGAIHDIAVEVDLHAGDAAFPFRATYALPADRQALVLAPDVVLPLTSALIRTQSERIQSSLRLQVRCGGELVRESTYRVGLAPVDEWQDGEKDEWRWLPSFVLPRDPAVARIVDSAHAILCALADDPAAGFDGYQSVDEGAADDEARYGCVDKQVQAIWYAILNQHGLAYINPPPSYGGGTQRLRTPSQLLAEKRGTCIDLALLLAACLEYVGIWPVLFLMSGHAYCGYWRSTALHEKFLRVDDIERVFEGQPSDETGARSARPHEGGVFGQDQRLEVTHRIHEGHLVPLEATWITSRGGFAAAVEEGQRNVRAAAEYQAMIDLQIARAAGVTPLPLLGAQP